LFGPSSFISSNTSSKLPQASSDSLTPIAGRLFPDAIGILSRNIFLSFLVCIDDVHRELFLGGLVINRNDGKPEEGEL
jgi:hypothetical protein